MMRIDALIHPAQWDELRSVLETLAVPVTLREVKTFGRTPPRREVYRGSAYYMDVTPELELTAIVAEHLLEATLGVLEKRAIGGELLVSKVEIRVPRVSVAPNAVACEPLAARAPASPHLSVLRHA